MREINLGKRPMKDNENIESSESSKRRRTNDIVSTGFGLGPAGRRHFLFADTA
jgi:hypothetical protein